jgi:catechol 2,3-dioxygenase-like lactoylglutathione lyase family enzyme
MTAITATPSAAAASPAPLSAQAMRAMAEAVSPAKLAHFVCLTDQLDAMRNWYMQVLNAQVAIENPQLCFLRYDEEHHRIGLIRRPDLAALPTAPTRSVHHHAFTYRSLNELFGTYLRLKERGIEPFWCVNHGPTTSMYYRDPDGHRIELQVDNFTDAECDAFFASGAYEENPIGVIFEPEVWITRLAQGEPPKSVSVRPRLPPGVSPYDVIRD